jgi:threonyl-tRNA synthetase
MAQDITLTLPDGAQKRFPPGTTGAEVAASISPGLAKKALAVTLDGALRDLARPIEADGALTIVTRDAPEALELIRHDAAHVMAQAVQALFPGTQVTIGPVIEDGFYYDFAHAEPFSTDDLAAIERKMREIVEAGAPFTREVWAREAAIAHFESIGEAYKAEIIRDLPEGEEVTVYRQGDWLDLCRGPHLPTTAHIGTAFKLMKVAGAYWRGDHRNAMLTRIYGTAWRNDKELSAYLTRLAEAEKRDHRRLGTQMGLFHFQEEAPGQVFWHPHGWTIYTALMDYMRRKIRAHGYVEINTPQMLDARFWQASGHWDKYRENMFVLPPEGDDLPPVALKPMSCPGGAQVYKSALKSYRDLPLRMAEFGHVVRREPSGARHGLMRVQAFTQDDAHIFCTDAQLEAEVVAMCHLIREVYADLGLAEGLHINLSTRPDEKIGSDADWDRAEGALQKVLEVIDIPWTLNAGDGAFYAPKLDFILTDAIGREWQCGTVQLDMNMPTRLDLSYIGEDGARARPHMIHRAIMGSMERFMGVLIEHYAGHLPLWLAPVQCVVATITSEADGYAGEVLAALRAAGLRAEADTRNEKINYKVREHSVAKVPVLLVVGAREAGGRAVALRRLGGKDQEVMGLDAAIAALSAEAAPPF